MNRLKFNWRNKPQRIRQLLNAHKFFSLSPLFIQLFIINPAKLPFKVFLKNKRRQTKCLILRGSKMFDIVNYQVLLQNYYFEYTTIQQLLTG